MKKALITFFLVSGMLLAGETKKETKWEPYKFKGTEHFKYALSVKEEDGKTQKGEYTIDLSRQDEKYKIKIKGTFAGNEGDVSTTVDDVSSIPDVLFSQMIFNPWLEPLTTTLFSNFFLSAYTRGLLANRLDFGEDSHWSYKSKDGNKVEFDLKGECKYAGRKGKRITMKSNGKLVYEACIDPDVALPLFIKCANEDNSSYSSMELVEYKE